MKQCATSELSQTTHIACIKAQSGHFERSIKKNFFLVPVIF